MKKVDLNFSKCQYPNEIHQIIKEVLHFPDFYGKNLDALWDCLYDLSGEALEIRVTGISHLLNGEDSGEYMNGILQVFDDIHKECPEIDFEIID